MFANNNGYNNYQQQPQQQYGFQAQPQQTQSRLSAAQMLDQIDSQGAKSVKFTQPGETVTGIVEQVSAAQVNVFDSVNQRPTNQPDYWQDGSPKLQIIVTIQTDINDPGVEDDDGRRSIYIKGWGRPRKAWLDAIRRAGLRKASDVKPGDRFTAKYLGYDPQSKNPNNPAKLYEYEIEHATPADRAMSQPQAQPQAGYYQPQPQQPYQPVQQPMPQQGFQQPQMGYAPQQAAQSSQPIQQAQPAQQAHPQINPQQVLQLKAAGKMPQEIAELLGASLEQVLAITDAALPSMHAGSEDEPQF